MKASVYQRKCAILPNVIINASVVNIITTIIIIVVLLLSSSNFGTTALSTSPNDNNILSYVTTHPPGPNLLLASCHIQADGMTFYCGMASGGSNPKVTRFGTSPYSLEASGFDIGSTFHSGCALMESVSRFVCVHSGTRFVRFYRLSDLNEQVSERLDMVSFSFGSFAFPLLYFDDFLYVFGPNGNSEIFRIKDLDTTPSIDTSFAFSEDGIRPRSACLAGTSAANRQIVVQFQAAKMATVDIVGTYPSSNFVEIEMADITEGASESTDSLACSDSHAYSVHESKIYKHQVIPNLVELDFLDLDFPTLSSPDFPSLRIFGGGQYMFVCNNGGTQRGALILLDISGTKFPNHTVIETISDDNIGKTFAAPIIAAPSGTDVRDGGTFKVFAFEADEPATVFELELENLDSGASIVIPPESYEVSKTILSPLDIYYCKSDQSRTIMYCADTDNEVPVRFTLEPLAISATGAVNTGADQLIFCDLGEALSGYYCLYDRGASSDFRSFNIPSLSTRDTKNLLTPNLLSARNNEVTLAFASIGGSYYLFLTDESGDLFRMDVDGNNIIAANLDAPSSNALQTLLIVVHCPTETEDNWAFVASVGPSAENVAIGRINGGLSNAAFPAGAYDNHVDLGSTFPSLQDVEQMTCSKNFLYFADDFDSAVTKISISPFAISATTTAEPPGIRGSLGIVLSPGDKYLLVATGGPAGVVIYDTSSLTLVESIQTDENLLGRCAAGKLEDNGEFKYYCPTGFNVLTMRLVPYFEDPPTNTKTLSSTKTQTLQSITATKTTSISASLQSRTKTSTKSITPSLQSLTATRTPSSSSTLQTLTRTISISKTNSPQSLTSSRTVSSTASLQSLTSTRTISSTTSKSASKSSSLQSLTQTRSHTTSSTLQSLTYTKTISKSLSLQSLTSTKTLSASQTLQSLTTTRSLSSTASLQSLTQTRSASKSATPFSLTRTLSHTSSATLFSRSKSLTVISPTKSKSLQSLTSTRSKTQSATPFSLTRTLSKSASATPFSRSQSVSPISLTLTRTASSSRSVSVTLSDSKTVSQSLQSLTNTRSRSNSATPISLTRTSSKTASATPFSRSKSLTVISQTTTRSASSTRSTTATSSHTSTTSRSLQSLTQTLTLFSRSSTLSSSRTRSISVTISLPPTPSKTRTLTVTSTRSASLQSLTKTLTKTPLPPPTTTTLLAPTTTTSAPGDNAINNLPPSSNILNALVVSVPSCPSSLNSKCQVRHPQSNECRCPQNTYEQNITLLPSFAFLPSTSPTSQLIDRVGNPCVRNEFTLGICTASTSERYISSYTRFGGTTSENGICEQANPFTNDCSCRVPSTKASFAIATGSPSSLVKKFVTFCLPSNGDLSVFWTIHPDVATSSSTSSNRAETSCVSPNGNVTCECAAGASKTTFGASIFPDSSSTDPVPGDLTFCKAKPAEPEEEVNIPITTTGTVVGIVGGFIEGGGANAVVGIQVAALLMTLCDNNPNVSTSGAKSVVVFFEYPGVDPSLGGLAFMLTLTLGVFTLHALLCLLLGFKRFATTEPIEFDPDRIDFFEDEIESPSFLEQIRFASLQLRFPHWSFFVMNIGFSGVVVESTILLQDTESDVNVLIGAIGLVLALIYIFLTLYYSYWGLRSVAPQKLFDIVESDQLQKIKKERKKWKRKAKKQKAATATPEGDDDEYNEKDEEDLGEYVFPTSRHQTSRRSRSSSTRKVSSTRSRSSRAQSRNKSDSNSNTKSRSQRSVFTPRSVNGSSSDDDKNTASSSSSSSEAEEDGHKWFSRRKSIAPPPSSSLARKRAGDDNNTNKASSRNGRRDSASDRRSSAVQIPPDDDNNGRMEEKDDTVIEEELHCNEDDRNREGKEESSKNTTENLSASTVSVLPSRRATEGLNKKINRKGPQRSSFKRNPLSGPPLPRKNRAVDDDDTTSSAEDLDLDLEDQGKEEQDVAVEESEEKDNQNSPSKDEDDDDALTEDDKPPHYVKYGKAIQMSAKYCSSAKWFLSDGWWIKFRLYNRRYASMYNSFQPRPTAWAPTTIRLFLFSVSVASSLGGCLIPVTYVGSMALLVAIMFLVARPCRRPFDNILLALQLILGSTLAFSRSSDPELSVRLFYGVIGVTFLYVFHICVMELLESFSMSNLELDARERK